MNRWRFSGYEDVSNYKGQGKFGILLMILEVISQTELTVKFNNTEILQLLKK